MQEYRRPYLAKNLYTHKQSPPTLTSLYMLPPPGPPLRFRRSSDPPSLPTRLVFNTLWMILLFYHFPTPHHPIHVNNMHTPTISPARSIGDVFPPILGSYWS